MAFYLLHNMSRNFSVYLRRLFCRKLCQRAVASFYHIIYSVQIELRLITMGYRHVAVHLDYYFFSRFYYAPHICNLRPKIEISVFIHRSNLKHRNVYIIVIVYP